VLLVGVALVVASVRLGRYVDDKNLTIGGMDAAVVVVAMAVAAVLCFATFLAGRLATFMRGRRGEGLIVLIAVTVVALASIPVSLFAGWAIWLSLASTTT
jgi:hypothetical protein